MNDLKQNGCGCYKGDNFVVLYFMQMTLYLFIHQPEYCRKLLIFAFYLSLLRVFCLTQVKLATFVLTFSAIIMMYILPWVVIR